MFNNLEIEAVYDMIIWSADVEGNATLLRVIDEMPKLKKVKLDRYYIRKFGDSIIEVLQDRGLQVFNDAKIVEIPDKVIMNAELELRYKPWMLNCMAGCTSTGLLEDPDPKKIDGLKRFADACHAVGTRPCGVTVLTSKEEEVVASEFNGRTSIEQVLCYVEMLLVCGFTDVVCSPLEISAIRAENRFDGLGLNTPGVRPAESEVGDQARTNTPEGALATGATRLVIGRPLTNGNPAENLDNIVNAILAA